MEEGRIKNEIGKGYEARKKTGKRYKEQISHKEKNESFKIEQKETSGILHMFKGIVGWPFNGHSGHGIGKRRIYCPSSSSRAQGSIAICIR